jgi:hypothetical protein
MKGVKRSLPKKDVLPPAAGHATVSESFRGTRVQAKFSHVERDGIYYLEVDEPRRGEFAEFREIWDIDFPEE